MNILHRNAESIDVVEIFGEIVMANSPEIRQQLQDIIDKGEGKLVLNLGGVNFIDSSGLSVLVSALKTARLKENGQVVLLKLMPEVRSLIELTRLHQIFDIFEEETTAVAHFG